MEDVKEEIDPDCHKDYDLINEYKVENMSIQCFYNRILGPQKYEDKGDISFWPTYHNKAGNLNIKVNDP